MNMIEATYYLSQNKRIRRGSWSFCREVIVLLSDEDKELYVYDEEGLEHHLTLNDIQANDLEVANKLADENIA